MPFVWARSCQNSGARRLTIAGALLTAIGLPMLSLACFRSAVALVVIEWTLTSLVMTPSLACMAEVTSFAGASAYGVGYGVYNTAWAVGLLAGPIAGGFLLDRLGFSQLVVLWAPSVIVLTLLTVGVGRRGYASPAV